MWDILSTPLQISDVLNMDATCAAVLFSLFLSKCPSESTFESPGPVNRVFSLSWSPPHVQIYLLWVSMRLKPGLAKPLLHTFCFERLAQNPTRYFSWVSLPSQQRKSCFPKNNAFYKPTNKSQENNVDSIFIPNSLFRMQIANISKSTKLFEESCWRSLIASRAKKATQSHVGSAHWSGACWTLGTLGFSQIRKTCSMP